MGSKGGSTVIGYWYRIAYHMGLGIGPIDAFLEFRGGDKTAWSGELTASGTLYINQPKLWGGESDQGGIVGNLTVLFGDASQVPSPYLKSTFGPQVPAWWGIASVVFEGGKYGALNPYPQAASYKIRKILAGWDNDTCWYPETAKVPLLAGQILDLEPTSDGWRYMVGAGSDAIASPDYDDSAWPVGASPFASPNVASHPYVAAGGYPAVMGTNWPITTTIWVRRRFSIPNPINFTLEIFVDNYATVWVNGHLVLPRAGTSTDPGAAAFKHLVPVPADALVAGENLIVLKAEDVGGFSYAAFKISSIGTQQFGMNPAHILYYARTHSTIGRVPIGQMNDASFRAGADWYYSQGFGLCTEYDPSQETLADFEGRITKVAGASINRSPVDGQYYLDVANGIYDFDKLEALTDDDVLDFSEQPTILDGAANSMFVKYFDPKKKEDVITSPVQALGLIDAFGTISQTNEYPEIPTGDLALRVAERDLRAVVTPIKTFTLKTTRKTYGWRPNQYKRLQLPKRGIGDMVVIVGDVQRGQLKSGAITVTVTQDVYSLPTSSYVEAEPGVDTRPSQTPVPIAFQSAFEAPYVDVVAALSRADLAVLPLDASFLLGVAADPAASRDFTLAVSTGADYTEEANGSWCPTATVVEASGFDDEMFTLANRYLLGSVAVGSAALWGTELVRVDALNASTGAVQFGRGCGDTIPVKHAAGERIWFYQDACAADLTEYAAGESINVKLLTNTGSQQLPEASAATMRVAFQGRAARPYPPGQFRINGQIEVASITGTITLTGVHRDRVQQANQLVDSEMATIGPEPGTTYSARYYLDGALVHSEDGLATPASSYTPTSAGALMRVEMYSVRAGLSSLQAHVRTFAIGQPLLAEIGDPITTEDNLTIIMG